MRSRSRSSCLTDASTRAVSSFMRAPVIVERRDVDAKAILANGQGAQMRVMCHKSAPTPPLTTLAVSRRRRALALAWPSDAQGARACSARTCTCTPTATLVVVIHLLLVLLP